MKGHVILSLSKDNRIEMQCFDKFSMTKSRLSVTLGYTSLSERELSAMTLLRV